MRILLVDHDVATARTLRVSLEQHGYSVDVATSTDAGEEAAIVDHHDVVVLVGDPAGLDAARTCRELRQQKLRTPIRVLSTPGSTAAKVAGLDAGADDCLGSPFQLDELLARLRSLLRRSQSSEGSVLRAGRLTMDLHEHRVTASGVRLKLSAKEFALLEFLMRNPRRLLTRTRISESVWDMNYEASSNVIDVYISSLRRKLHVDGELPLIETVIGCGYRFVDADEIGETSAATRPAP
jgi:DNA-binding response OmpR family regulator